MDNLHHASHDTPSHHHHIGGDREHPVLAGTRRRDELLHHLLRLMKAGMVYRAPRRDGWEVWIGLWSAPPQALMAIRALTAASPRLINWRKSSSPWNRDGTEIAYLTMDGRLLLWTWDREIHLFGDDKGWPFDTGQPGAGDPS